MEFTAKQLAQVLRGTVEGDPQATVTSFAKIEHGKPGQLCFFANPKYEKYVYTCRASVLLVNKDFTPKEAVTSTMVRVDDAYKSLADLLKYVSTQRRTDKRHRGFRSSWFLTTKFGKKVYLGSHSYVGHHAKVGDYTKIYENVYVGDNTVIGSHCIIYPGVVIYPGMVIGDNVIIHATPSSAPTVSATPRFLTAHGRRSSTSAMSSSATMSRSAPGRPSTSPRWNPRSSATGSRSTIFAR